MKSTLTAKTGQKAAPQSNSWQQLLSQDWALAAGLFLLVLLSRIPFQSQILYHWDSVNFAYAVQEYNLAKEHPHPPGYIGYVWLTQLVDTVLQDAQTTLVTISMIASALAVVVLFFLGQAMFNRTVGLIAAGLLATSPLFWFYGEIALPHTLDTFLIVWGVWWMYETMRGNRRYLYPGIVVMAVAGGIRPQTLVFLGPLILFSLHSVGWKKFVMAGLLGAVICLGWFIPLMVLSGGVSEYMRLTSAFGSRFQESTSLLQGAGWFGLQRNVIKLTLYTVYAWSLAAVPAAIYVALRFKELLTEQRLNMLFLLIWILPSLLFYVIIHMGQQGLVFVFLPALLLLSAQGLYALLQPRWLAVATATILLLNVGVFVFGPEYPLGNNSQRLLTWETLQNNDRYYQARFAAIEQNFAPDSAVILASSWHHVQYYLPEYRVLKYNLGSKWELNEGQPLNQQQASLSRVDVGLAVDEPAYLILFNSTLNRFNQTPEFVEKKATLTTLRWPAGYQLGLNNGRFGLMPVP